MSEKETGVSREFWAERMALESWADFHLKRRSEEHRKLRARQISRYRQKRLKRRQQKTPVCQVVGVGRSRDSKGQFRSTSGSSFESEKSDDGRSTHTHVNPLSRSILDPQKLPTLFTDTTHGYSTYFRFFDFSEIDGPWLS